MTTTLNQSKNRTKFVYSISDILHWSVHRRGPIIKQIISTALEAGESLAGGSHTELIQISFQDFEKLAKPKVVNFSIKG